MYMYKIREKSNSLPPRKIPAVQYMYIKCSAVYMYSTVYNIILITEVIQSSPIIELAKKGKLLVLQCHVCML